MNDPRLSTARLALAAWMLAGGGAIAHGQLGGGGIGQVQFFMQGQLQIPGQAGGMPLAGDAESEAIGDPWWDEAESKPEAGAPDAASDELPVNDRADAAEPRARLESQAEMMRRQLERQALPVLRRELSVVREACPTLEQPARAAIVQAGRGAIEKLMKDRSAAALRRRLGGDPELEQALVTALQAALATAAGAPEAAAYERERGLRRERDKQATIAALVADVDRDAGLRPAEREALTKVLAESYRERWQRVVKEGGSGAGNDFALQGFDRCVEKALGKDRTAEWLARREEARQLAAGAGGEAPQMIGEAGWVDVEVQGPEAVDGRAGGQPMRRIIRRRVMNNGGGLQLQIEVQVGGPGAGIDEEAAPVQKP